MSGVSCSKEDKLEFKLLQQLKLCMDISMWKDYDPDDHDKNASYYEPWYKRLVPSSAAVDDALNKYQVRYMLWLWGFLACINACVEVLLVQCKSIAGWCTTGMLYL